MTAAGCGDQGDVARDEVLGVLRRKGVGIQLLEDEKVLIEPMDEIQRLKERVSRKTLHRLANKLGIEISEFYHPDARPAPHPMGEEGGKLHGSGSAWSRNAPAVKRTGS